MSKCDAERYRQFGKCCWTCENKECHLSQINGQPPFESNEGRDCECYENKLWSKAVECNWFTNCLDTPVPTKLKEGFILIVSWHWHPPDGVRTSYAVVKEIEEHIPGKPVYRIRLENWKVLRPADVVSWVEIPSHEI